MAHAARARYRGIRIDRSQLFRNVARNAAGSESGLDHPELVVPEQRDAVGMNLPQRDVDVEGRRQIERRLADVFNHAHDLDRPRALCCCRRS